MSYTKALLAGVLALLALPAFSQSSPAPVIDQRKENQQDRIANGVQSGQLTAGETSNLEKKEAGQEIELTDQVDLRIDPCLGGAGPWRAQHTWNPAAKGSGEGRRIRG